MPKELRSADIIGRTVTAVAQQIRTMKVQESDEWKLMYDTQYIELDNEIRLCFEGLDPDNPNWPQTFIKAWIEPIGGKEG